MDEKTKTITGSEARALLQGSTPGPWVVGTVVGNGNDSPGAVFDVTAETCGVGEAWACRANARLMAAAPDLAAAVVALWEHIDHATEVLEVHRAGLSRLLSAVGEQKEDIDCDADIFRALENGVADMWRLSEQRKDERDAAERLRAIIEGRTTPPTREEFDAHVAGGGWWRGDTVDGAWDVAVCSVYSDLSAFLREAATEGVSLRWWAHDRTSRPCAWPVVGGAP